MEDEAILICDMDEYLTHGRAVLKEEFYLPQLKVAIYHDNSPLPVIMSYNLSFFSPDEYVWIKE